MSDELVSDNLEIVLEAVALIETRFAKMKSSDEFVRNAEGVLLLDAISMRLQVIGEMIKKIDKLDGNLLQRYPEIEWEKIMKLRDILSHHYDRVDHEIVYDICKFHIPILKTAVEKMLRQIQGYC